MTAAPHDDARRSGSRTAPRFAPHPRTVRTARAGVAVAVALALTGYIVTRGAATPSVGSTDAGAWLLDTSVGTATHVNGLSGSVDGEVSIPGSGSGGVVFGRQGENAIAVDDATGRLGMVDSAGQSFSWVTRTMPEAIVDAGASAVYVTEPGVAEVWRYDARNLKPAGRVALPSTAAPGSVQSVALDGSGTLWVADQRTGEVIPVGPDGAGSGLRVATAGDKLVLSAMTGGSGIVVLDDTRGVATEVSGGRTAGSVLLGTPGRTVALALGSAADPAEVPVLRSAGAACDLEVADLSTGAVSFLTLRSTGSCDGLLAPVSQSQHVYVPDDDTGSLDAYDAATRTMQEPVTVTGTRVQLDVFALDGQVWANDPAGPDAVVIGPGGVHHIVKYGIAVSPTSAAATAPVTASSSASRPSTAVTVTAGPTSSGGAASEPAPPAHVPPSVEISRLRSRLPSSPARPSSTVTSISAPATSPSPTRTPTASASGPSSSPSGSAPPVGTLVLTVTAGPGYVDLVVTPPPGAGTLTYQMVSAPTVTITKTGSTTFRASTPLCLNNAYAFQATATSASGATFISAVASAFGCVPPGPVSDFTLTGLNGSIDVNWGPPVAPGTAPGNQLAYVIAWIYDNDASGGPGGDAQLADPTSDGAGGFIYQIPDVPLGVHVLVEIVAGNASGYDQNAALNAETTAWDLSACASKATTCTYNQTTGATLDESPGGTPTGTSLPGTPTGTFGVPVTVLCQTTGPTVTLPSATWAPSDVWDQIDYGGSKGFVSDLYVSTANSMLTTATPQYPAC